METFYLEEPEDKYMFPIELEWVPQKPISKLGSNYIVNIEDGLKRDIEIRELEPSDYSKRKKMKGLRNGIGRR